MANFGMSSDSNVSMKGAILVRFRNKSERHQVSIISISSKFWRRDTSNYLGHISIEKWKKALLIDRKISARTMSVRKMKQGNL